MNGRAALDVPEFHVPIVTTYGKQLSIRRKLQACDYGWKIESHVRFVVWRDGISARWLTEFPLANDVRDWIAAHLPSGDHNCLLHSDLLPQNLLYDWQASSSRDDTLVGIVDWEMARVGDPAYDLAIVSRGNRKVLGVKEGLKVLLEEYLEFGGKPISLTEVRVHELLLVLYWLEESWREHQKPATSGHGPDFYETKLASLFRRAAS